MAGLSAGSSTGNPDVSLFHSARTPQTLDICANDEEFYNQRFHADALRLFKPKSNIFRAICIAREYGQHAPFRGNRQSICPIPYSHLFGTYSHALSQIVPAS